MTEIDVSQLNFDGHDECDHSTHQSTNQSTIPSIKKPAVLPVFDNVAKSQFSKRQSINDLPILSVVSPMKLNAIINQSTDQSINQSAVIDLLKLVLQCQSERSQIYSVFNQSFAGYIDTVQSTKSVNQSIHQSMDQSIDQSDNKLLQKALIEESLKDYTQLCQRIIVLFKHCSLSIKSIISRLATVNQQLIDQSTDQSDDQSTDQSTIPSFNQSIREMVIKLQELQSLEQSKLALTIQRQDATSQFIVSINQPYHPDYLALMDDTRIQLGDVIRSINDILDEIREFVYSE